ncbi:MAG: SEC-C domain-containing protein [Acidimicrobiia bacterium]|nr:SEC-C domain-containing protein [Acidimicrobiia bacterium]
MSSTGAPRLGHALAWFPAEEWTLAVQTWPDLTEEMPTEHADYVAEVEARTKRLHRTMSRPLLFMVSIDVAGLQSFCADSELGLDAGSGAARAHYAASLARTGTTAASWPPGRNDLCWCRSGRKYKRCCGPVPEAVATPAPTPLAPDTMVDPPDESEGQPQ